MVKKVAKKSAKKTAKKAPATKRTPAVLAKQAEVREGVIRLLLRKSGALLKELKDIGWAAPAQGALRVAETRGLKTSSKKADGEFTRYFASGTPSKVGAKKAPSKKAVKKATKKSKKAAKPASETASNGSGASASA